MRHHPLSLTDLAAHAAELPQAGAAKQNLQIARHTLHSFHVVRAFAGVIVTNFTGTLRPMIDAVKRANLKILETCYGLAVSVISIV